MDINLNKCIKSNMLIGINYKNLNYSLKKIKKEVRKNNKNYFKFEVQNFLKYLN